MYLEHFGLKALPFTITPDTGFFMNRAGYQDALNVLLVALRSGEGFIKVTGEVGVGKTLLCRKLLNSLMGEYTTAYIYNPYLEPDTLLFAIADELGVEYEAATNRHILQKHITRRLLKNLELGKRVILCLDEVQAMPVRTLETLRLLTNIETEKRKLIQVVLFGQPELDVVLEQPSIRQLKQRITFAYTLKPLNRTAVKFYIRHRLTVAGCKGRDLFSAAAMEQLHGAGGGIPRMINILSHKAMLAAYGRGDHTIGTRHVRAAVKDSPEAQRSWWGRLYGAAPQLLHRVSRALGATAILAALIHYYR
jgi:MSHA biogenesis protein MshM